MKKLSQFLILILCVLVFISGCKNNYEKGKTYNIIMTSASIPPMISMLDTIGSEDETYAWIGRQNTINSVKNLKDAYAKMNFIESWSTASNIPNSVVSQMSEIVSNKWFESNETAKFNIYVTDYGIVAALYLVETIGVPTSNYKIHMVEDGSSAYTQFLSATSGQGYASENGHVKFNENLEELNEVVASMRNDTFKLPDSAYQSYNLSYVAATLPSVDYYLQFPSLLTTNSAEINLMLENKTLKLVEKNQTDMFKNLSAENQEKFKNIVIAKETLDNIEKDDKEKVLMITGTSFPGEGDILTEENVSKAGKDGNFEIVVNYLVNTYSNYKIIYKGHPAWGLLDDEKAGSRFMDPARYQEVATESGTRKVTTEEAAAFLQRRCDFLNEKGIVILPAQTPAEAIIWAAGDDLLLAGYDSSLYMNAKPGSLVAFFEGSIEDLGELNQLLYGVGGAYFDENIKYLTPEWCKEQITK